MSLDNERLKEDSPMGVHRITRLGPRFFTETAAPPASEKTNPRSEERTIK
jgi:hypothetical protein